MIGLLTCPRRLKSLEPFEVSMVLCRQAGSGNPNVRRQHVPAAGRKMRPGGRSRCPMQIHLVVRRNVGWAMRCDELSLSLSVLYMLQRSALNDFTCAIVSPRLLAPPTCSRLLNVAGGKHTIREANPLRRVTAPPVALHPRTHWNLGP